MIDFTTVSAKHIEAIAYNIGVTMEDIDKMSEAIQENCVLIKRWPNKIRCTQCDGLGLSEDKHLIDITSQCCVMTRLYRIKSGANALLYAKAGLTEVAEIEDI